MLMVNGHQFGRHKLETSDPTNFRMCAMCATQCLKLANYPALHSRDPGNTSEEYQLQHQIGASYSYISVKKFYTCELAHIFWTDIYHQIAKNIGKKYQ